MCQEPQSNHPGKIPSLLNLYFFCLLPSNSTAGTGTGWPTINTVTHWLANAELNVHFKADYILLTVGRYILKESERMT